MTNEQEILQKAIDTWGQKRQIWKFGEECCEAAKEVFKMENGLRESAADLIEEIADVSVMVDQMRLIWGPQIAEARRFKLERLEQKMKPEAGLGVQKETL